MVGTSGGPSLASTPAALSVFTEQANSYSMADLAGVWQGNTLVSGDAAPWWERDTLTIHKDGSSSVYWTVYDGSTGSATGTFTITPSGPSAGAVTWACADCSSDQYFSGFMDADKTVMVMAGSSTDGLTGTTGGKIGIFTKSTAAVPEAPATVKANMADTACSFTATAKKEIGTGLASRANTVTQLGTGLLTVTLDPEAAVNAGAKWSVDGGGTWNVSRAKTTLPDGTYTVSFKDITSFGWNSPTPATQSATILQGRAKSAQGLYVQQTGSLNVAIDSVPTGVSSAMWSLTGGAPWHASGAPVSNLPVGSHTVTFKPIAGWNTAKSQTVSITYDNTATAAGTYTQPVMTFVLPKTLGTVQQCSSSFSYQVESPTPGVSPYTYKLGTGSPLDITIAASSGLVSGQTSSPAGTYSFKVCVDDADGGEVCKPTSIKVTAPIAPAKPSGPSPGIRATGVPVSPALSWTSTNADSYDVYLGTTSSPPKVASDVTSPTYTPSSALNTNTTYYWRVIAKHNMCTGGPTLTAGPVWSFKTSATLSNVKGTAAAGDPIQNTGVTLVDSTGATASGTTGTDGSFSIPSAGLKPPFLLKVTTGSGTTYYSVSADSGMATTINITPLTDMIVRTWYMVQGGNVDTAFGNPAANPAPAPVDVLVISSVVQSIVQPWLQQAGVATASFNAISTPFTANGTGVDQVLAQTSVTINSGTIAVAISDSATTQNSTVTPATNGTVTCSTTATTSTGTTSPVTASTTVPTATPQQTALDGINATISNFMNTVNKKGASLSASDLAPYVDSNYLDSGQTAAQWETKAAKHFAGSTMSLSGLQVNSLDTTNNVADVSFQFTRTQNGVTSSDGLQTTFTLPSGGSSWLISGNGWIATAYASTWGWENTNTNPLSYTNSLRFEVDDPRGVVTGVTVSGPGTNGSMTVPIVCGGSTGISCGTAYGDNTLNAFQIDLQNYWPLIPSTYTFTLTTSTGTKTYNWTVDNAFGFNAEGQPVPADYPYPMTFAGGTPNLAQVMGGLTLHGSVTIPIWVTGMNSPPHFNYEGPAGQSNSVSNQLIDSTWDSGTAIPGQVNNFTIVVPAAVINSTTTCSAGSGTCYNITFEGQTGEIQGGWFGEDACYSGAAGAKGNISCTNSGIEIQ